MRASCLLTLIGGYYLLLTNICGASILRDVIHNLNKRSTCKSIDEHCYFKDGDKFVIPIFKIMRSGKMRAYVDVRYVADPEQLDVGWTCRRYQACTPLPYQDDTCQNKKCLVFRKKYQDTWYTLTAKKTLEPESHEAENLLVLAENVIGLTTTLRSADDPNTDLLFFDDPNVLKTNSKKR